MENLPQRIAALRQIGIDPTTLWHYNLVEKLSNPHLIANTEFLTQLNLLEFLPFVSTTIIDSLITIPNLREVFTQKQAELQALGIIKPNNELILACIVQPGFIKLRPLFSKLITLPIQDILLLAKDESRDYSPEEITALQPLEPRQILQRLCVSPEIVRALTKSPSGRTILAPAQHFYFQLQSPHGHQIYILGSTHTFPLGLYEGVREQILQSDLLIDEIAFGGPSTTLHEKFRKSLLQIQEAQPENPTDLTGEFKDSFMVFLARINRKYGTSITLENLDNATVKILCKEAFMILYTPDPSDSRPAIPYDTDDIPSLKIQDIHAESAIEKFGRLIGKQMRSLEDSADRLAANLAGKSPDDSIYIELLQKTLSDSLSFLDVDLPQEAPVSSLPLQSTIPIDFIAGQDFDLFNPDSCPLELQESLLESIQGRIGKMTPPSSSMLLRNELWVKRLQAILQPTSIKKKVFVVVGKDHLLGTGSFIEQLTKSGYRIIKSGAKR